MSSNRKVILKSSLHTTYRMNSNSYSDFFLTAVYVGFQIVVLYSVCPLIYVCTNTL